MLKDTRHPSKFFYQIFDKLVSIKFLLPHYFAPYGSLVRYVLSRIYNGWHYGAMNPDIVAIVKAF